MITSSIYNFSLLIFSILCFFVIFFLFFFLSSLLFKQIAGLDLNDHQDPNDLCDDGLGDKARYVPPHLRSSGGNNNSGDPEYSGGNRNFGNRGGYRNDNRRYGGRNSDRQDRGEFNNYGPPRHFQNGGECNYLVNSLYLLV